MNVKWSLVTTILIWSIAIPSCEKSATSHKATEGVRSARADVELLTFKLTPNRAVGLSVEKELESSAVLRQLLPQVHTQRSLRRRELASEGDIAAIAALPVARSELSSVATPASVIRFFDRVLPQDATEYEIAAISLWRQVANLANGKPVPTNAELVGKYYRAERFVRLDETRYRVAGAGSRAVLFVGNDKPESSIVEWNQAVAEKPVPILAYNDSRILSALGLRRLSGLGLSINYKPELVYFDTRTELLPAYRFVSPGTGQTGKHEDVQFVTAFEPVRVLGKDIAAETPPQLCKDDSVLPTGVTFDRYVISGDMIHGPKWLANASAFGSVLATDFVRRRFCNAKDEHFDSKRILYADGASITLVEAHGSAGEIYTDANSSALSLGDINGFGSGVQPTDGLRLLILHSCNVLEPPLNTEWYDIAFKLFQGIHTVVGFRTDMLIADGVSVSFAEDVVTNMPLLPAWLARAAAVPEYSARAKPGELPLGRAAAIAPCDGADITVTTLVRVPMPQCLVMYWHSD